jgi:hypothetical protein
MATQIQHIRTLRLKVKAEGYAWLNAAAIEVNQVWNFANATSYKAARPFAGQPKCDATDLRRWQRAEQWWTARAVVVLSETLPAFRQLSAAVGCTDRQPLRLGPKATMIEPAIVISTKA